MENKNNLIKSFDDLPKWIGYDTGCDVLCYHPIIFKWENVGLSSSFFAMYARYYPRTARMDPSQVLFYVHENNFERVVFKFIEKYNSLCHNINAKWLWTGGKPQVINFPDGGVIKEMNFRNINRV